jgi:hypothetical protein
MGKPLSGDSWAVSNRMKRDLAIWALDMALANVTRTIGVLLALLCGSRPGAAFTTRIVAPSIVPTNTRNA